MQNSNSCTRTTTTHLLKVWVQSQLGNDTQGFHFNRRVWISELSYKEENSVVQVRHKHADRTPVLELQKHASDQPTLRQTKLFAPFHEVAD